MKTPIILLQNTQRYRHTPKGLITNLYNKLKERNKVDFTREFLQEFSQCKKFERLYSEWVKSNYNKQFKPSIDRISNKVHYTKNNIQWLTWSENRYKQNMERRSRKGVVYQMIGDKIINKFKSQREAVIKTGISQGNMSEVLNGKRKTCGGYKFIFENPELIK
jgi:hypothetical protein